MAYPMSETIKGKFCKIRFSNGTESTAGLVVDAEFAHTASIAELSRMFPCSEAPKMKRLIISHPFDTFEAAFNSK